jgi:Tol biopolymer transport system component/tRNA A-37 threonylcarbamoyl transferase component Bud32
MLGQTFGHYRIESKLGEGGMGVVYKARDLHLDRFIALKVLRPEKVREPERRRRFIQEAKAASALSHPNIIHVYDIDQADGVQFMAIEYVEGKALGELIGRKGLAISETLNYGVQIADALAAAHAAGIIHRDIKPGNIMVNEKGLAKVLDFGLAKLVETTGGDPFAPTVTIKDAARTEEGAILGTVAYMSPEQAEGKKLDARSDIFSFGSVLYQMLTGKRPFQGETRMSTLSAILSKEPKRVRDLVPELPLELERVVSRCLRKDPARRFQNMADVKVALEELRDESASGKLRSGAATARKLDRSPAMLAAVAIVLVIGFGLYKWFAAARHAPFQKVNINRITGTGTATAAVISPDGRYVVHSISEAGRESLWMRQVATDSNVQIVPPALIRYTGLTLSRDGNLIYYVVVEKNFGTLYEMPLLGGTARKLIFNVDSPVTLAPDGKRLAFIRSSLKESAVMIANVDGTGERKLAPQTLQQRFFSAPAWSPDGKLIACAAEHRDSRARYQNLFTIPADGGQARPLTSQKWYIIKASVWLPDGEGLLLNVTDQSLNAQIWYVSYPRGESRAITNDLNNYDGISLTANADALTSVQSQWSSNIWIAPSSGAARAQEVTSGVRRDEGRTGLCWTRDGKIVYISRSRGNHEIWIVEPDGRNSKQLTFDGHLNFWPRVSPDGQHIAFDSDRAGSSEIWTMGIDGSAPKQLTRGGYAALPDWSPDSKWVVYHSTGEKSGLWKVSLNGSAPVHLTDGEIFSPAVAPEGKRIAFYYMDDQASPNQGVAVVPFEGGRPIQRFDVTPSESSPVLVRWTPDGSALLYVKDQAGVSNIWSQPVAGGPPNQVTDLKADQIFNFDVSRDGKQFVLARGAATTDVVLIRDMK